MFSRVSIPTRGAILVCGAFWLVALSHLTALAQSSQAASSVAAAAATPTAPAPVAGPVGAQSSSVVHPPKQPSIPGSRLGAKVRQFITSEEEKGRIFKRADATFPAFCKDWERKLRDRERYHIDTIKWTARDGYQTATYLGYSGITSCACKKSAKGTPVGKLSYQEIIYYITGKTIDEALHSTRKQTDVTNTTEIFGFNKDHWEY